jgi:phosphoglycerol transferase MdoB-like AlkP superfamily enzyme
MTSKFTFSMKNCFIFYLYWLIFSWLDRAVFLLFTAKAPLPVLDVLNIYRAGLKLDLSMAAYLTALPFLVYIATRFFVLPQRLLMRLAIAYAFFFSLVLAVITAININLYPEWSEKISRKAFDTFLEEPSATLASASTPMIMLCAAVVLVLIICARLVLKRIIGKYEGRRTSSPRIAGFFLLGAFLLFTFIRGGYGRSTLNESTAYHSAVTYNNHAAINTYWALISDFVHNNNADHNPYAFYEDGKKAEQIIAPLLSESDSVEEWISREDCNIVLIVLESFTADLVGHLGGVAGNTPNLDALADEGITFERFYAAAERSDKGIVGIYSGFPAQGVSSIIKLVGKQEKMPAIGQLFKQKGYATVFYHGGQSEFYNFKSYMLAHGIDKVVDKSDFDISEQNLSWGVDDAVVFKRMAGDLKNFKTPYFASIFTLTNHEPFDLPVTGKYGKATDAEKLKSTAFYTDSLVGDFLSQLRAMPAYENTLVIITADHGHRLPFDRTFFSPRRFQIPLIITGGALKAEWRGKKISTVASQVDLAGTLLAALNLNKEGFPWSRNLFCKNRRGVAFFNTSNNFGMVTDNDSLVVDFNALQENSLSHMQKAMLDTLKAYNQKVYEQYLHY